MAKKKVRDPDAPEPIVSRHYSNEVVITFDPIAKRNRYTVEDGGVILKPAPPSVTTITGLADFGKSSALQSWAVRMCIEVIRANIKPDEIHGAQFLEQVFTDAQANYRNVTKAAADTGTLTHAALERHFTDPEAPPPLADTPVRACFDGALNWYNQREIETIGNEIRVYSRQHKTTGTLDHLARVNGVVSLLDFKAAKNIYSTYLLQLGAYRAFYMEEHPDVNIEQAWILQLHDDGAKPYKYTSEQLDAAYQAFLNLRGVFEWNRAIGKIVPEEKDWLEG
jgi:hypothetical protein